jgi:CIC family chloride channel protein
MFIKDGAFMGASSLKEIAALPWYFKVFPPAIGGLIVGPLIYFFAREAKGHGIPEVMNAVSNHGGKIRRRVMTIKTIASAITIGTGGSVGREGPIIQIGAGLGSSVGQLLGFDGKRLIIVLGCGAAAGMAATFNAPIAGVILAVEVIIGSATINIFSPLVVASVTGTVVTRLVYGNEPFMQVPAYQLQNPLIELPLYVVLGILSGLVAWMFTKGIIFSEDLWEKFPIPAWLSPMAGGLIIGILALLFPQILGVGYETLKQTLQGNGTLWVLVALIFVKIFASATTLGSGGSGGVFAPARFVGAALGGAFGLIAEQLFPGQTANSGAYALVGMGAVLAGATHAPITIIIMLFELTATYTIILPLMLSCIIALVVVSRLLPTSVFTTRLLKKGIKLRGSSEAELMRTTKVRQLLHPFPETLPPVTPMSVVLQSIISSTKNHQYVVDDKQYLLGVITLKRVKNILREEGMDDALMLAVDIMDEPLAWVNLDDTLDTVMSHMSRLDIEVLPVLDDNHILMGTISRSDIMVFFDHEILKKNVSGMHFVPSDKSRTSNIVELPEDHVIQTVKVNSVLGDKTLKELNLRATTGINVIGIERPTGTGNRKIAPDADVKLKTGDILTVVGSEKDVETFTKSLIL